MRGQSTTVGYVLSVGIATVLVAGLIAGVGTYVEQEQRTAVQDELEVIGQRLATQASTIDAVADRNGTVYTEPEVPERVVGVGYRVSFVVNVTGAWVRLTTPRPAVAVAVPFAHRVPVVNSTTRGSDLAMYYNSTHLKVVSER